MHPFHFIGAASRGREQNMSVDDLGSWTEHRSRTSLGIPKTSAWQARRESTIPLAERPTEVDQTGAASEREALGPWGLRPAPAPPSITMRMLRGIDRLALAVVYAAVCTGLPLVFVGFATGVF